MITIRKNPIIKLNIPDFSCDSDAVGKHLNEHPLTQLLNVYGFLCVIGRPGQGKTSLTIALMTQAKPKVYKKTHHHMIILMPANSIASLKKNVFKVLPEENIYNELTDKAIHEIYTRIDGYSEKGEKTLLFIDDMTADLKRSKFIQETLKKLIYNRRHLKCNLIITAQSFTNIPLDIRKNIQNLILFRPSKKEMELIFDELFETRKSIFQDIMRMSYDDKHNFLFLNIPSQRLFKNFDELIINEDDNNLII